MLSIIRGFIKEDLTVFLIFKLLWFLIFYSTSNFKEFSVDASNVGYYYSYIGLITIIILLFLKWDDTSLMYTFLKYT